MGFIKVEKTRSNLHFKNKIRQPWTKTSNRKVTIQFHLTLLLRGAQKFIELLKAIFNAKELRRYDMPDGSIMHTEIQIEDSVIMLGDASEKYPPVPMVMHVYVAKVDETFQKAIAAGCEVIEHPKEQEGDPDRRGTFKDFAGNMWSVATQM